MSEDGAARKVKRLDAIGNKIREHGNAGIAITTIKTWSERQLGLSSDRVDWYLKILERNREIFFDPSKRRYYHVEAKP